MTYAMKPYRLHRPESVEAAVALAAEHPGAKYLAGGTDLVVNMRRRIAEPGHTIDLGAVAELRGIRREKKHIEIGACATIAEIAEHPEVRGAIPILAEAAGRVAGPTIRGMATLGGNLVLDTRCLYYNQSYFWRQANDFCLKKDGTVCWVAPRSPRCWAHSASDAAPVLCALGARVRLISAERERIIPVEDLFRDDGIDYLSKRSDEIISDVLVPAEADSSRCRSAFWKLRRRGAIDFAVLSVAVALWTDRGGNVERARIFLGAVASRPVSASDAERSLEGEVLTEGSIAIAARLARRVATPLDNTDFQPAWRGKMAELYTEAALRQAAGLDPGLSLGSAHS